MFVTSQAPSEIPTKGLDLCFIAFYTPERTCTSCGVTNTSISLGNIALMYSSNSHVIRKDTWCWHSHRPECQSGQRRLFGDLIWKDLIYVMVCIVSLQVYTTSLTLLGVDPLVETNLEGHHLCSTHLFTNYILCNNKQQFLVNMRFLGLFVMINSYKHRFNFNFLQAIEKLSKSLYFA